MILVGDAAGLESTGLCDGVPAAWFSADIAADIAIESLKTNDTSAAFLSKYDRRIKAHPIIQWTITCKGRWNLRQAQESHRRKDLKAGVNYQFGPGILTHVGTPLTRCILGAMRKDLLVMIKWVKMFMRYYYNWEHERFGGEKLSGKPNVRGVIGINLLLFNLLVIVLSPLSLVMAWLLAPLAWTVNPIIKLLRPLIELILRGWIKMEPLFTPLTNYTVNSVKQSDASIFDPGK